MYKFFLLIVTLTNFVDTFFTSFSFCPIFFFLWFFCFSFVLCFCLLYFSLFAQFSWETFFCRIAFLTRHIRVIKSALIISLEPETFESGKFWQTSIQYLVNVFTLLYSLMIKGITESLNIFTFYFICFCYTIGSGFIFKRSYKSSTSFYSRSLMTSGK